MVEVGFLYSAITSDSRRENIGLSKLSPDSTINCKVPERPDVYVLCEIKSKVLPINLHGFKKTAAIFFVLSALFEN